MSAIEAVKAVVEAGTTKSAAMKVLEWILIVLLIYGAYAESVGKLSTAKQDRDKEMSQLANRTGDLRERVFRLETEIMHQGQCKK